eukprot:COSAG01_NODE_4235_length_5218_cov_2.159601_5_plen_78_part_00
MQKQRAVRKLRKEAELEGEAPPRWFHKEHDPVHDREVWMFGGEYWEAKVAGQFEGCDDLFSTEDAVLTPARPPKVLN